MKKKFVCVALGVSAMTLVCGTGAFAAPLDLNMGVNVAVTGMNVDAGLTIEQDAKGTTADSAYVSVYDGADEFNITLGDVIITTEDTLYLNARTVIDNIESVTGQELPASVLNLMGVTEDWLSLPMPDFAAVEYEVNPDAIAETAGGNVEISEELMTDLFSLINYFPATADGDKVVITIDKDSLLEASKALDELVEKHQEEILSFTSKSANKPNKLNSLDLKPALAPYIQAAAEGYAQATDATTEEAVEYFNALIDQLTEQAINSANASVNVNGQQMTAETLSAISFHDAIEEALADQEFAAEIAIADTQTDITVKSGENSVVLSFVKDEDGTITATLGDGTNVFMSAGVVVNEDSFSVSVLDAQSQNEMMNLYGSLMENGFTVSFDSAFGIAANLMGSLEAKDEEGNGMLSFDMSYDEETFSILGYFGYQTPEEGFDIAIPEACADGLEVIKNISMFYFSENQQ